MPLTLIPLTLHDHTDLLQAVYDATPGYWQMYGMDAAPELQALHDLRETEETLGRAMLGILHPTQPQNPPAEGSESSPNRPTTEMIGVVDIRMHHPERTVTTVGRIMVAEPWQRQGHGRSAWALVEAWLTGSAGMHKVRAGVEQFNPGALHFFTTLGFTVTPEAVRTQVGEHLVRLLYVEKQLSGQAT